MKIVYRDTFEGEKRVDRMIGFVHHSFDVVKSDPYGDLVPFTVGSNQGLEDIPTWDYAFEGDWSEAAQTAAAIWEWMLDVREQQPYKDLFERCGYTYMREICCELAPPLQEMWIMRGVLFPAWEENAYSFYLEFAPKVLEEQTLWSCLTSEIAQSLMYR